MLNRTLTAGLILSGLLLCSFPAQAENNKMRMHRAITLSIQGNQEEALKILREIVREEPENFFAHNNLGLIYAQMGRRDRALDAYRAALKIKPDFAMTLNNMGQIYKEMGDYPKSETYFKKALKSFPGLGIAHGNLGELYLLQKDIGKALPYLKEAVKLVPVNPKFHLLLAQAYKANQMEVEAKKEMALYRQMDRTPPPRP